MCAKWLELSCVVPGIRLAPARLQPTTATGISREFARAPVIAAKLQVANSNGTLPYCLSLDALHIAMQLNEALLCASAPTTSASGPGTLSLHDIQTGTSLASWKQTSSANHCAATVHTRDGQGGFMLAAQQDKSILNVYSYQKVRSLCSRVSARYEGPNLSL